MVRESFPEIMAPELSLERGVGIMEGNGAVEGTPSKTQKEAGVVSISASLESKLSFRRKLAVGRAWLIPNRHILSRYI